MTASLCAVLNDAANYNDDVNQLGFPSNKNQYKTGEIIFFKNYDALQGGFLFCSLVFFVRESFTGKGD